MPLDFPLLLAGPVLRRVNPDRASVWVALSKPATVSLAIWEGLAESGQPDPFLGGTTQTRRIGDKLHLAVVSAASTTKSLLPGELYSYDITIKTVGANGQEQSDTLKTLGLLEGRFPLGYDKDKLPSFAPCPPKLDDLNVLFGSCRRPSHPDPDGLAMVDDLISAAHKDPKSRPHQLLLGGDQIYADDVSLLHMVLVMARATHLIGVIKDIDSNESDEFGFVPVEHVLVDKVRIRDGPFNAAAQAAKYVLHEPAAGAEQAFPVDRYHFPEGRRLSTTLRDAQFTSTDGHNHIISLGEFAALYLSVWSTAIWGDHLPGVRYLPLESPGDADQPGSLDPENPLADYRPIGWDDEIPADARIVMPKLTYPERIPANLYWPNVEYEKQVTDYPAVIVTGDPASPWKVEWDLTASPDPPKLKSPPKETMTPEEKKKADDKELADKLDAYKKQQQSLRAGFKRLQEFRSGLPKVQRALANVATYMIMDDHDVTDDYFLSPIWRDRVLTSQLGQSILRNGMIAYALFQDWGNDPMKYAGGKPAELLSEIEKLFPPGQKTGPDAGARENIAKLLGHDLRNKAGADGRFAAVKPPLTWHFMVDGPKHRVVAFDNRTRRSYASENGPPGNVSVEALVDQLPAPPLPEGREILVVVAPLQVIGPPVLDDVIAPASFRALDLAGLGSQSNLSASSSTGMRQLIGTDPDAIEAWAFDALTFEHLLERLAPYGRVVLLSGDVHYSASSIMTYWRGDATKPAHFAQFTSSGLKNVMPSKITFVDRAMGFAQQMIRANLGAERVAWKETRDDLILYPQGKSQFDLPPSLRSKLKTSPVLAPTWGWLDLNDPDADLASFDEDKICRLNPQRPPDWMWRVLPIRDERPETERPDGIKLDPIDNAAVETNVADKTTLSAGYLEIAKRHQHAMMRMRNARQILFRANVSQLRFTTSADGQFDATHNVYTTYRDPDLVDVAGEQPKPEKFMVHVAHLGTNMPEEDRPGPLRRRAIDMKPGGPS